MLNFVFLIFISSIFYFSYLVLSLILFASYKHINKGLLIRDLIVLLFFILNTLIILLLYNFDLLLDLHWYYIDTIKLLNRYGLIEGPNSLDFDYIFYGYPTKDSLLLKYKTLFTNFKNNIIFYLFLFIFRRISFLFLYLLWFPFYFLKVFLMDVMGVCKNSLGFFVKVEFLLLGGVFSKTKYNRYVFYIINFFEIIIIIFILYFWFFISTFEFLYFFLSLKDSFGLNIFVLIIFFIFSIFLILIFLIFYYIILSCNCPFFISFSFPFFYFLKYFWFIYFILHNFFFIFFSYKFVLHFIFPIFISLFFS